MARSHGRPAKAYKEIPRWYAPINNQRACVEESHASSIAHFTEVIAIGELLGRKLPEQTRERISALLREVDALKIELRAHWLELNSDTEIT